jgi:hypothetical protein
MCTTENTQENEDAAWKYISIIKRKKDYVISLNTENLLSQLNELAKERSFKIYIGKMIYDLEEMKLRITYRQVPILQRAIFYFSLYK